MQCYRFRVILFRATSRGKLAIRVPRGSKTLVQQKDRRLADDSHTIRFVKRAEEFSGLLDSWNKIGKIENICLKSLQRIRNTSFIPRRGELFFIIVCQSLV